MSFYFSLPLMANSKKTKPKVPDSIPKSNESKNVLESNIPGLSAAPESLPMTSYISVVGVHTTLWSFVALYLPRNQLLGDLKNSTWDDTPVSSRDRPQHPFLDALTVNPTATLLYICLGAVVLQSWWAGYLRDWWLRLGVRGTEEERKTEIALLNRQKLSVRNRILSLPLYSEEIADWRIDDPKCLDSDHSGVIRHSLRFDLLRGTHHKVLKIFLSMIDGH